MLVLNPEQFFRSEDRSPRWNHELPKSVNEPESGNLTWLDFTTAVGPGMCQSKANQTSNRLIKRQSVTPRVIPCRFK